MESNCKSKHEAIIVAKDLKKSFKIGTNQIKALRGVNLQLCPAEFIVIFGPSGCGKTTLLNIIAGIDKPSSGELLVRGTNIFNLNEEKRGIFRAKKMGIIHQMPYWVRSLNVLENVALPLIIEGIDQKSAEEHALKVMKELKIDSFAKQLPTQLSGGQQQRAGLARALSTNPWILLADEPTGNLDSVLSDEIMDLFNYLNKKFKRTIILATHNKAYWNLGTRRIEMKDGEIIKDTRHN